MSRGKRTSDRSRHTRVRLVNESAHRSAPRSPARNQGRPHPPRERLRDDLVIPLLYHSVTSPQRRRLDNRAVNRTLAGIALAAFLATSFAALAEPQKGLSRSERKERVKNLSDKYPQF